MAVKTKMHEYVTHTMVHSWRRGTKSTTLLYTNSTTVTTTSENILACGWYCSPTIVAKTESLSERMSQ